MSHFTLRSARGVLVVALVYSFPNVFNVITLKFILSLVSRGLGTLQGNFGTGVQLKLRKHPNAYIAIKWNLNLLVITFLTTLTPMARVVWRNDASPSDVHLTVLHTSFSEVPSDMAGKNRLGPIMFTGSLMTNLVIIYSCISHPVIWVFLGSSSEDYWWYCSLLKPRSWCLA
jgi:hypothetical protein